jgi:archaellum biogenesis ATPase FlaH
MVDESEIEQIIIDAMDIWADENNKHIVRNTFNEIGMLTNNKGIVLDIEGSEFQITIVQS